MSLPQTEDPSGQVDLATMYSCSPSLAIMGRLWLRQDCNSPKLLSCKLPQRAASILSLKTRPKTGGDSLRKVWPSAVPTAPNLKASKKKKKSKNQ
ncbi:hypothetical protein K456DRAFT_57243 [Colletotrichum gloeosporioides 23]|nr:hypothetical protein K456DRAFT_57243 [Colletotrichum gloeosporioides 23]